MNPLEKLRWLQTILLLFQILKDLTHVSMVCVFHVSEFWWACSKFPCAWWIFVILHWSLILLPQFLVAWRTFSCRLTWEFSTSDFELLCSQFPGAWPILFLSSLFTGLTRYPELDEEVSSLHWLCITRFKGVAFAVGEPPFEVVSRPRFDMAPITMCSLTFEREL